jgi:hypothetical protein
VISENTIETVLRARRRSAGAVSGAPHAAQNLAPSGFDAPHCVQNGMGRV